MKAYAQGKQIIVNDNASVVQTVVQPKIGKDTVSVGPVKVSSDNVAVVGAIIFVLVGLGYLVKKLVDKKLD
jgi:hypothetical protein